MQREFYPQTDQRAKVSLFWGTKDINKEKIDRFNGTFAGDLIWDDSFDIDTPAA